MAERIISYFNEDGTIATAVGESEAFIKLKEGYRLVFHITGAPNATIEVDGISPYPLESVREMGTGFQWKVSAPGYITQEGVQEPSNTKIDKYIHLDKAGVLEISYNTLYPTSDSLCALRVKIDGAYLRYDAVTWTSSNNDILRIEPYSPSMDGKVVVEHGEEDYYAIGVPLDTGDVTITARYGQYTDSVVLHSNSFRIIAERPDGTQLGSDFELVEGDWATLRLYYGDSDTPINESNSDFYRIVWAPSTDNQILLTPLTAATGEVEYYKYVDAVSANGPNRLNIRAVAYRENGSFIIADAYVNLIKDTTGNEIKINREKNGQATTPGDYIDVGDAMIWRMYGYNWWTGNTALRMETGVVSSRTGYYKSIHAPKTGYYRKVSVDSYLYTGDTPGEDLKYMEEDALYVSPGGLAYEFAVKTTDLYPDHTTIRYPDNEQGVVYNLGTHGCTFMHWERGAQISNDKTYITCKDGSKAYASDYDIETNWVIIERTQTTPQIIDTTTTYVPDGNNGTEWRAAVELKYLGGFNGEEGVKASWINANYVNWIATATTVPSADTYTELVEVVADAKSKGYVVDGSPVYCLEGDTFYGVRFDSSSLGFTLKKISGRFNTCKKYPWAFVDSLCGVINVARVPEGEVRGISIGHDGSRALSGTEIRYINVEYSIDNKVTWESINDYNPHDIGGRAKLQVEKRVVQHGEFYDNELLLRITGETRGSFYVRIYRDKNKQGGYAEVPQPADVAHVCEVQIIGLDQLKDYYWYINGGWNRTGSTHVTVWKDKDDGDFHITGNAYGQDEIWMYSRGYPGAGSTMVVYSSSPQTGQTNALHLEPSTIVLYEGAEEGVPVKICDQNGQQIAPIGDEEIWYLNTSGVMLTDKNGEHEIFEDDLKINDTEALLWGVNSTITKADYDRGVPAPNTFMVYLRDRVPSVTLTAPIYVLPSDTNSRLTLKKINDDDLYYCGMEEFVEFGAFDNDGERVTGVTYDILNRKAFDENVYVEVKENVTNNTIEVKWKKPGKHMGVNFYKRGYISGSRSFGGGYDGTLLVMTRDELEQDMSKRSRSSKMWPSLWRHVVYGPYYDAASTEHSHDYGEKTLGYFDLAADYRPFKYENTDNSANTVKAEYHLPIMVNRTSPLQGDNAYYPGSGVTATLHTLYLSDGEDGSSTHKAYEKGWGSDPGESGFFGESRSIFHTFYIDDNVTWATVDEETGDVTVTRNNTGSARSVDVKLRIYNKVPRECIGLSDWTIDPNNGIPPQNDWMTGTETVLTATLTQEA